MSPRFLLFFWLICSGFSQVAAAALTAEQRTKIKELTETVAEAGKLYSQEKYLECATKIVDVEAELLELLKDKDRDLLRAAKPLYSKLQRIHGILELEGAELKTLPSWADVSSGKSMDSDAEMELVSFKDDIAPWFVSACGNCHITAQRGQFSMANFSALQRGVRGAKVVYAGDPKGSKLVEVIESGDMPRGNAKVTPEQLAKLKAWVAQGAKFDGPNPNANLNSYVQNTATNNRPTGSQASTPTGAETVSFSKDVAPVLLENCKGCHIGGQRPSGNLNLGSFAQMMRGGDSGELISGTNANDSLIIKKLKGQASGRQMPAGRPPLSDETISMISTWIREGATFDGPTPDSSIDVVVGQGWASTASHAELFERRKQRALEKWERVLPNDQPSTAADDEVFVLGNVTPSTIEAVQKQTSEAVKLAKRLLKAPTREPLVKGGIVFFVLKSRYDYSEFGKMTENRELPQQWLGHWMADPLDVYAVLAGGQDLENEQAESIALQLVAGAYVGSFAEVPTWFAEGVARNLVVGNFRRDDERIKQWQADLPVALQKVDSARTLLDNRLDEESAGLTGMALTSFMMNPSNRRRFDRLLAMLRSGKSFTEATTFTYAPPDRLVKVWLGKK